MFGSISNWLSNNLQIPPLNQPSNKQQEEDDKNKKNVDNEDGIENIDRIERVVESEPVEESTSDFNKILNIDKQKAIDAAKEIGSKLI
jgi:hypothetical protein